jgi:hypothetical protein
MKMASARDRVRHELRQALDRVRADLDRIEILTGALNAFSKPVPDYEPKFRHISGLELTQHQIA